MGTTWSVTLGERPAAADLARLEATVSRVLDEVDASLSTWNPASEISAFNRHAAGDWVPLSGDLHTVLAGARTVSAQSGGAFDVTVAPLVALWGFGPGESAPSTPRREQIDSALARVGFDKLELRQHPGRAKIGSEPIFTGSARKLVAGLELDVNAIAPGYAVDRISDELTTLGYADHIVEIGGEVRCRGRGPRGRRWRIAIEKPQQGVRAVQAIVALDDLGISTSGDYRDFRVVDGHRIPHTIDPRSGTPVAHGLASVSVVHGSVMLADAYATALMVMGPQAGHAFAERLGLPALFVERSSDGFVGRATSHFEQLHTHGDVLPQSAHN
jgi:FAD:protein FMN transferase